ncbi:CAZyme family GH18 [Paecilomyces variotii]|nr:CAZyme family GH18 [Paecilomyces variotii]
MGLLIHLSILSQVAVLAAAASSSPSVRVADPYIASQWNACPSTCESANLNDWDLYSNLRVLKSCNEPMLLNLVVSNPTGTTDSSLRQPLYACSTANVDNLATSKTASASSASARRYSTKNVQMETAWRGDDTSQYSSHAEVAAQLVQSHLNAPASQNATIAMGYSNGVVVGAFIGSNMEKANGENKSLLNSFLTKLRQGELNKSGVMMQVCDSDRTAAYTLGVVAEANADYAQALGAVREALATWNTGKCVSGYSGTSTSKISVSEAEEDDEDDITPPRNGTSAHVHVHRRSHGKRLLSEKHRRATCTAIRVNDGDSCSTLATRCGISPADFTKYNPSSTLCSSLLAGQHVCCSAGTLPDYSPQPNADGTCASYTVQNNDWCSKIAAANSITVDDIEDWNEKSWGWTGCDNIQAGANICVSKGEPPMPSVLQNAVCGPQKAGTKRPDNWDDIESLNPCPLNACCDIWGQCGTTADFCTRTNSTTGAPGTAKAGTNGCISNCGTDIVYDDSGFGDHPVLVGYYEAFQNTRPCLNMDVTAINNTVQWGGQLGSHASTFSQAWDHIHFAFANITESFEVDVSSVQDEFDEFKKFTSPGKKPKVLSFGGWSFSTALDSYAIFRKGVTDEQRSLFASNVAKFADDNDLDGLDFDWEYPGSPDIPGIPAGDPGDGARYLQFLKEVRDKLSSDKTLSIAAPASYWYLKGFPIANISSVVDYIVYMTYDLHGQWDWNNPSSDDGCDGSACLRSHVNYTEIVNSLSMITKAGVPNSKIVAGLASYGRSFGMVDPSCYGPECKFTGPDSGAMPGRCTQTPGYIANAEINEWLQGDQNITTYFDEVSRSTISYSANGTWVAYTDDDERNNRITEWWYDRTVLGTSLWAIDLTEFVAELPDGTVLPPSTLIDCDQVFTSLDDVEAAAGSIQPECMNLYLIQALQSNLTASVSQYHDVLKTDYDEKFGWYQDAVREQFPLSLQAFLKANASNYFECTSQSMEPWSEEPIGKNTSSSCPSNPKDTGYATFYWTATDKDGFLNDLEETTGITPDQLLWEIDASHCVDSPDVSQPTICSGSRNIGMPNLPPDFTVSNPKDIISARLPNITTFENQSTTIVSLANSDLYLGDTIDVVDGASLLVLMVSNSIASMKSVEKIGTEYHKEQVEQAILLFVSALLLLIPGLGEIADSVELTSIAITLRAIGAAGDAGFGIYGVVSAKDAGVGEIFLALLGGLGILDMLRAPGLFAKAAKARRAMDAGDIAKLGNEVKGGIAQIDKLKQLCH